MPFGHQEQLDAGEEGKIFGDLRLIEREDVGAIIELDFNPVNAFGVDAPRLLAGHYGLQPRALRIGDGEAQNVLGVILNRVPAGRPGRQLQAQLIFMDVLHVSGDVKEMLFLIGTCARIAYQPGLKAAVEGTPGGGIAAAVGHDASDDNSLDLPFIEQLLQVVPGDLDRVAVGTATVVRCGRAACRPPFPGVWCSHS